MSEPMTDPAAVPFRIALPVRGGEPDYLECRELVRALSNRRYVYRGLWRGQEVFAKIYTPSPRAERHWRRELSGANALREAHIDTPPVLFSGPVDAPPVYVHVSRSIAPAVTLNEAWASADSDEERTQLLCAVARVLARQHAAGLIHRDAHFGNFLLQGATLYTLDGSEVARRFAPLRPAASLRHLAAFLSIPPPQRDELIPTVFAAYMAERGWTERTGVYLPRVLRYTERMRRRRNDKYLTGKIFRECTRFSVTGTLRRRVIFTRVQHSPALASLLADTEAYIAENAKAWLKRGNTSTVVAVNGDDADFVIKRYNIKGRAHALKRALRRTRAAASWQNSHRLAVYGIDSPTALALIETRLGPLRSTAYFVSRRIDGIDARSYFSAGRIDDDKRKVADAIVGMFRTFQRYGISHGDMKATNIIIVGGRPYVLDLDGVRQTRWTWLARRRLRKDISRFLHNWAHDAAIRSLFAPGLEALIGR